MIKYLSNLVNLNNEPKIEIEAKLVRNINDSVSFVNPSNVSRINLNAYKVDINHILFFHIKFSGLTDNDELFIANHNPFIYKGYYYDEETGFYYVSSRYYSPELCRWISPDSIEYLDPESINGLNLYAYCENDPINKWDPSGKMPVICSIILLGCIGIVANVAGKAMADFALGNEFKIENYLVAAGAGFIGGMCYAIPYAGGIVSAAVTSALSTAGQMAVSEKNMIW